MLIDVNSPFDGESLNRLEPWSSYHAGYLRRIFAIVEAFKNYPNTVRLSRVFFSCCRSWIYLSSLDSHSCIRINELLLTHVNKLLFFVGNEVINDIKTGATVPPYLRVSQIKLRYVSIPYPSPFLNLKINSCCDVASTDGN